MVRDVVVAGLGILGACALREVALRGADALGIDALSPPHTEGSSHGRTRIIRDLYFEDPLYVPLVRWAREGWRELEAESGFPLYRQTGLLSMGLPGGALIKGTLASARAHGVPHERLDAEALQRRWPELRVEEPRIGVLEEQAGVLNPESCVQAALDGAQAHGAQTLFGTRLMGWEEVGGVLELRLQSATDQGGRRESREVRVRTRSLILALGPWLGAMEGQPFQALQVERQVTIWYEVLGGSADRPTLPVLLWEPEEGPLAYAIPDSGDGWKVARHHGGEGVDPRRHPPGSLPRQVTDSDRRLVEEPANALVPGYIRGEREAAVCFYTNTPDGHFLVGSHPEAPGAFLLGGGSGHAFKFAPALAARMADLIPGLPAGGRGVGHLWPGDQEVGTGLAGDGRTDPFAPARRRN